MTAPAVLDASALLAWMRTEPGAALVGRRLLGAVIATPNWSEVWQKLDQYGVDADRALARVRVLGVLPEVLTSDDAVEAARCWRSTRSAGLSLGDRCCLALGMRLGRPVLTADRSWSALGLDVAVEVIR